MIKRVRRRLARVLDPTPPGNPAAIAQLRADFDALALELRDLNATTTNGYREAVDTIRAELDFGLLRTEEKREAFDVHVRAWVPEYIESLRSHLEVHAGEAVDHATVALQKRIRRVELAADAAPSRPATGEPTAAAGNAPSSAATSPAASTAAAAPPATTALGYNYSAFEDELRGSPEHVKTLEAVHVDTIAGFGAEGLPVLDVGCGRGELLQLLRDAGIAGRGIDLNPVSVAECRDDGLDVVEGDAVAYLDSLDAGSLRAVVGLHIVEHLTDQERGALLRAAQRAIAPGGGVIVETPNPENLRVGSTTFWLDPTHLRPVPPQLLEFQVAEAGFDDVEIQRLHPSDDVIEVPDDADPLAVELAALVNRLVTGPMDYAVIGRRRAD